MQLSPALHASIQQALQGFAVQRMATTEQPRAAVALVLTDQALGPDLPAMPAPGSWSNEAALLLTRRALHLRNHAGQWALPGGRIEPGESPTEAALREVPVRSRGGPATPVPDSPALGHPPLAHVHGDGEGVPDTDAA